MLLFNEFFRQTDERQIDSLFSKAHIAVEIVRLYDPNILNNISTIANLSNGVYGVYNSGENQKIIPKDLEQNLIYYGKVNSKNLGNIPKKTLIQYFPQLHPEQIKQSDTVHVNVARIMKESGSDFDATIEIASTIIHEATHEIERETTGFTSEVGPLAAERKFKSWVESNKRMLFSKFPQLQGDIVGPQGIFTGRV